MVNDQPLRDVDAAVFGVDILPAQSQQLTAGYPGLQHQHQGEVAVRLGRSVSNLILRLREGLFPLHGLVFGQLDGAGHGAFDAQLVVYRRVEDQLQTVVVFFYRFRCML